MTGPFDDLGTGPHGPDPDDGDHVNVVRAVALLVVAVVAGALLLGVAARPNASGSGAAAGPTATTSTTSTTVPPTTTTTTAPPPKSVSVLVANGTSTAEVAAHYTTVLQGAGWSTGAPTDTTATVDASTVYYAAGQEKYALDIATQLGLSKHDVAPLTASVPVPGATGVDVVLVAGPDLAASMSTTTTSTATTA